MPNEPLHTQNSSQQVTKDNVIRSGETISFINTRRQQRNTNHILNIISNTSVKFVCIICWENTEGRYGKITKRMEALYWLVAWGFTILREYRFCSWWGTQNRIPVTLHHEFGCLFTLCTIPSYANNTWCIFFSTPFRLQKTLN